MPDLTEAEHQEYQGRSRELQDIRHGLALGYFSKNWWRRNRSYLGDLILGAELALIIGLVIWFSLLCGTALRHPLPPVRDYPYIIQQVPGGTQGYWLAKKYYTMPDGGLLVLNEDVMVRHNRMYDMGCYALPDHVTQLEFEPYTVTVKER